METKMNKYNKAYIIFDKISNIRIISFILSIITKLLINISFILSLKFGIFKLFIYTYKINGKINRISFSKFKNMFLHSLYKNNNLEQKCYYFHIVFVEKFGTPELLEEYIKTVSLLNNKILQYRLAAYEIPWVVFTNPNYIYDKYYIEHRNLLDKIANNIHIASNKIINHNEKCIAIMVMGLHSKRHASARLEIYLANEFVKHGYKVTIFVADTNKMFNDENYALEPLFTRHNDSTIFKSDHNFLKDTCVNIVYNHGNTAEQMYNNFINAIYEYAPEFIIDITWENAVFNPILKKDYKIISVPLGGNITAADIHGYVSRNIAESMKQNKKYKTLDNVKMRDGNIYIPYDLTRYKRFKREIYGIKKEDFVIITVGNRLEHEISDVLFKEMFKLLDNNDNIKWILVGSKPAIDNTLRKYIINKKIILWGYERELPSLYAICDCFLNPARVGGAGSVLSFIQSNKPAVVANLPSDTVPFIDVKNTIEYTNDKDLVSALIKIYTDKYYGVKLAASQKERLMRYELTPEYFIKQIIDLYNEIKG